MVASADEQNGDTPEEAASESEEKEQVADENQDEREATKEETGEDEADDESTEEGEDAEEADEEVPGTATILHLNLEGLDLDLLGLEVDLAEVDLDVSAVPGEQRLLGNLLSAIAGLLDGAAPGGGGVLSGLLPDVGSLREKLPGLPSLGGFGQWLRGAMGFDAEAEDGRGILRRIGSAVRGFLASILAKLPLEEVIARGAQAVIDGVVKQLDERAGEAAETAEEAVTDGGIERIQPDGSDGIVASDDNHSNE